jgi:hypothetical protein
MDETTNCVATYHAEQPQNQQNYKNRPKHLFFLLLSTTPNFVGTKAIAIGLSNAHAAFALLRFPWVFGKMAASVRTET